MSQDIQLSDVHFYLMDRIMREAKALTKEVFQREGIEVTVDQWVILKAIAEQEGASQQEVSGLTFREPAAITRMLDHLIKKGLVSKVVDKEDRRKQLLYLSEEGRALYDLALPLVFQLREHALTKLNESQRITLRDGLKSMLNSIQDPF